MKLLRFLRLLARALISTGVLGAFAWSEESASAAEEMSAQTEALKEAVTDLLTLVNGRTAAQGVPDRNHRRAPAAKIAANGRRPAPTGVKAGSVRTHGDSAPTVSSRGNVRRSALMLTPGGSSSMEMFQDFKD